MANHDQHPSDRQLLVAAVAGSEPEAAMIIGLLSGAGIKAMTRPGTGAGGLGWGAGQQRSIYVLARDLERAQEALGQDEHRSQPAKPDPVPEPKRRFGFLHRSE